MRSAPDMLNWEAAGAIGEIVGALAVVVTLVFLLKQIRRNTDSVRTATIFNIIHEANTINSMIGHDPSAARIFELAQNAPEELAPDEEVQAQALVRTVINLAFAGYLARGHESVPDELWDSLRKSAGDIAMTEGGRKFLLANAEYFGDGFVNAIAPHNDVVQFDRTGWVRTNSES